MVTTGKIRVSVSAKTCVVCNETSHGVKTHYKKPLCNGCRSFVKRVIRNKVSIPPCRLGGVCPTDQGNRRFCRACRYNKCVQENVRVDPVQTFDSLPLAEQQAVAREGPQTSGRPTQSLPAAPHLFPAVTPPLDVTVSAASHPTLKTFPEAVASPALSPIAYLTSLCHTPSYCPPSYFSQSFPTPSYSTPSYTTPSYSSKYYANQSRSTPSCPEFNYYTPPMYTTSYPTPPYHPSHQGYQLSRRTYPTVIKSQPYNICENTLDGIFPALQQAIDPENSGVAMGTNQFSTLTDHDKQSGTLQLKNHHNDTLLLNSSNLIDPTHLSNNPNSPLSLIYNHSSLPFNANPRNTLSFSVLPTRDNTCGTFQIRSPNGPHHLSDNISRTSSETLADSQISLPNTSFPIISSDSMTMNESTSLSQSPHAGSFDCFESTSDNIICKSAASTEVSEPVHVTKYEDCLNSDKNELPKRTFGFSIADLLFSDDSDFDVFNSNKKSK